MSNLTTHKGRTAPTAITPDLDLMIRKLHSRVEIMGIQRSISSLSAPTDGERGVLMGRLHDLADSIRGTDEATVTRYIAALLTAYATKATSVEEKRLALKLYVSALVGFPEWAIDEALTRLNSGKLTNGNFAPAPSVLAQEIQSILQPVRDEMHKISDIVNAKIYHEIDSDERARVGAMFDGLLKDVVQGSKPERGPYCNLDDPESIAASFREAAEKYNEERGLFYSDKA